MWLAYGGGILIVIVVVVLTTAPGGDDGTVGIYPQHGSREPPAHSHHKSC